jgi:hypothetical protein
MKLNYKRSFKLITILVSSLLIGTVSASVYYTMFMNATVGVAGNKVQFWAGDDFTTAGGSITDARQKVTFSSMNGINGSITTITDPVKINNTDGSSPHTIELKLDSWTGDSFSAKLYYINITMYDATNAAKGNEIYLVPGGSGQVSTTGTQSMPVNAVWRVQWEIYWKGAATASDSITINLKLEVTS